MQSVARGAGEIIGGHFRLEARIGSGGMGTVYRARDLRLGREVALKLDLGVIDLDRLRREGAALARLAHPNVVVVHEVGEHDGALFVAMELVAGGTARQWLDQAPRPWRAVLELYAGAGRGLAAAHDAGLIHRDVKPDNILVGSDGRARIGDFGLAREAPTDTNASPRRGDHHAEIVIGDLRVDATAPTFALATGELTLPSGSAPSEAGVVLLAPPGPTRSLIVGTPRYMAPEQAAGRPVDARADQFSFCVALYEALCGVHPYAGSPAGTRKAAQRGVLTPPVRRLPRRLIATIARGLRPDPDARWPSMDELLAALAVAARPRGRRILAVAVPIATAAVAAGAVWVARTEPDALSPCLLVPATLDSVWGPARRHALGAALTPAAGGAATDALATIDARAEEWTLARATACQARPPADWSQETVRSAAACLSIRASQLDAAIRRLLVGELPGQRVMAVLETVERADGCSDRRYLAALATMPSDPAERAATRELLARLDRAEIAIASGDLLGGLASARAVANEAARRQLGYAARYALVVVGRNEVAVGDELSATEHLRRAFFEGRRAGDGWVALDASALVTQLLLRAGKLDDAATWAETARAEADHLALPPSRRANMDRFEAIIAETRGRTDEAIAAIERGVARLDAADVSHQGSLIDLLGSKATILGNAGRHRESIAAARLALEMSERLHGVNSPQNLSLLGAIGLSERDLGERDQATRTLRRALDIAEASLPHDGGDFALAVMNYGVVVSDRDPRAAIPLFERALGIYRKAVGNNHPDTLLCLDNLAEQLALAGRSDEALRLRREGLDLAKSIYGGDAPQAGAEHLAIGLLEARLGQRRSAREHLARAVAIADAHRAALPMLPEARAELARLGGP